MLIEDKSVKVPLTVLCAVAASFVILMYICVPIGSFFPTWGYKFFPLTGKWFKLVFTRYHGFQAFRDSFVLSLIAAPITALLSMIISYLVVKRKFKAKGFIEAVSMLAMAVPADVLATLPNLISADTTRSRFRKSRSAYFLKIFCFDTYVSTKKCPL